MTVNLCVDERWSWPGHMVFATDPLTKLSASCGPGLLLSMRPDA